MSDGERDADPELGDMMALIVHDLRNPLATISANLSFAREVQEFTDVDVIESLDDVELALGELAKGLEQLGWVSRWLAGGQALTPTPGDVREMIDKAVGHLDGVTLSIPDDSVQVVTGGAPLIRLLEILAAESLRHGSAVTIRLSPDAVVEVIDDGVAVGADLRPVVFTMAGQQALKTRADGRYAKVVGLLAVRALADAMGATLEVAGEDGAATIVIRLRGA